MVIQHVSGSSCQGCAILHNIDIVSSELYYLSSAVTVLYYSHLGS